MTKILKSIIPLFLPAILIFLLIAHFIYPANAEQFYIEYLNTAMRNRSESIEKYLYFNDPRSRELAQISSSNRLLEYEILSVEQLSNELWAFTCDIKTDAKPEGKTVYNFVGVIDGSFRVMTGIRQIPDYLKKTLDLSKYTYPDLDTVDIADVILY